MIGCLVLNKLSRNNKFDKHNIYVNDKLDAEFDDAIRMKFQRILQATRCLASLMIPVLLDRS